MGRYIAWLFLLCTGLSSWQLTASECVFSKLSASGSGGSEVQALPASHRLTQRRQLQQSSTCSLSLGSSRLTFAACESLQSSLGSDVKLLYTVTTPSDQAGPVLHAAIDAASTGWAGFGIPATPGEMVGASAMIAKTCPTCASGASVDSYYLADTRANAVQPPGRFTVLAMQAQLTIANRLQAYFEIVLTPTANSLKSTPLDIIYALGALSGTNLRAHEDDKGVAGTLDLSNAFSSQSPNATAAAPATAAAAAPASAGIESSSQPTSPPSPSAASPAATPAPLGTSSVGSIEGTSDPSAPSYQGSGTTLTSSATATGCTLQAAQGTVAYSLCQTLLSGSNAKLYWNLNTAVTPVLLTAALEATTTGWIGFGFPATPGAMLGGNAVIAQPCSTCPTGASINSYNLGGYSSSAVLPPGKLSVVQMNATSASGLLYAQFTLQLQQTAAELAAGVPIIAAQGPVASSGLLQAHALSNSLAASVNFGTGATSAEETPSDHDSKVHGILMVVGFGILIPIGVLIARTMKSFDPWWFELHRAIQVAGLCLGIAGFGMGLHLGNKGGGKAESDHKIIGYTVVGAAILQMVFGMARVKKNARWRLQWSWFHRLFGMSIVVLACGNVFLGLHIGQPVGTYKFVAGFIAFLAALLALAVLGSAFDWWRGRRAKQRSAQFTSISAQQGTEAKA